MKYNGDKFMNLRIGKEEIIDYTRLFTPNIEDPINEVTFAKDLGIMVNNKLDFKVQRKKVITLSSNSFMLYAKRSVTDYHTCYIVPVTIIPDFL